MSVIPAVIDFVFNKYIDGRTQQKQSESRYDKSDPNSMGKQKDAEMENENSEIPGDAKMSLICIKVVQAILRNEYYN